MHHFLARQAIREYLDVMPYYGSCANTIGIRAARTAAGSMDRQVDLISATTAPWPADLRGVACSSVPLFLSMRVFMPKPGPSTHHQPPRRL